MTSVIIGVPFCKSKSYILDKFLANQSEIKEAYPDSQIVFAVEATHDEAEFAKDAGLDSYGKVIYWKPDNKSWLQNIANAREALRRYALKTSTDYLFMVDSDMTYEPGALQKLINEIQGYDAVFSAYRVRQTGSWGFGSSPALYTKDILRRFHWHVQYWSEKRFIAEDEMQDFDLALIGAKVKRGAFITNTHYADADTGHVLGSAVCYSVHSQSDNGATVQALPYWCFPNLPYVSSVAALQSKSYLVEVTMSVTELYRAEGLTGILRGAGRYTKYHTHTPTLFWQYQAWTAIRDMPSLTTTNPSGLVSVVYDKYAGLLRPVQVRSEITQLVRLVQDRRPAVVVEIGTATGGTLFILTKSADPKARIISIDLPGGNFGGGYPEWKKPLYESFALPGQRIMLLRRDSHGGQTKRFVQGCVAQTGIDFLFIDGDHTYKGVKSDFEMYGPLVNKGGMIAFHDIVEHPKETGCEVSRFWNEAKQAHQYKEIVEDWHQGSCGIGVLLV